jgi:hypothetical protein
VSREPSARERKAVLEFLDSQSAIVGERLSRNEKIPLPEKLPEGMEPARAAAFVDFCHTLLSSNEFLYVN